MFSIIPNYAGELRRGIPALSFTNNLPIPALLASHTRFSEILFGNKPVLMLVRSPHDVMVSWFFHKTRHQREFVGNVSEFTRSPQFGIETYIAYINGWASTLVERKHLVVSYENLQTNTYEAIRDILTFLKIPLNEALLKHSIELSKFDRMQKAETKVPIPDEVYDVRDTDACRVRRGKIGGHKGVLSQTDYDFINEACERSLNAEAKRVLTDASVRW